MDRNSRRNQLVKSSGYDLKWLIHTSNPYATLPVRRATYNIAVKSIVLSGLDVADHFVHICVSPKVSPPTYLLNNVPVSAIKSIAIDQSTVRRDFDADEMEYFSIDFMNSVFFSVSVVDNNNSRLNVTGTFIFDIVEICK